MMNATGLNLSDPHIGFCFNWYNKCHSALGPLDPNETIFTAILKTECGQNWSRVCGRRRLYPSSVAVLHNYELPTLLLVIFILISACSFLANGFVCVVYSLSKEIRTAKHYFMVNLAMADVLIAIVAIPFYLTEFIPDFSKTLCKVGSMVDVLCCTCSIMSFTVISLERFVAVKYPLRYQTIVSRKHCLLLLACVWIFSVSFSAASWIPVGKHTNDCVFFTDYYLVTTTFVSFLLPLLVMLLIYGWIYKVAKHQARQINYNIPRRSKRLRREFKAAKTLMLIIGAFVLCWLPFFCYMWVFGLCKFKNPPHNLYYIVQIVRYLNSLANPFIYVSINREFRHSTYKLLKRCLPDKERRTSETNNYTQTTDVVLRKISATSLGAPELTTLK